MLVIVIGHPQDIGFYVYTKGKLKISFSFRFRFVGTIGRID